MNGKEYEEGITGAELFEAVGEDRGDDALLILEAHPFLIHIRDPAKNTVLHSAAAAGSVYTIQLLLRFMKDHKLGDVNLYATNANGDTALHLSLKNSHHQAALYLIKEPYSYSFEPNKDGVSEMDLIKESGFDELLKAAEALIPVMTLQSGIDIHMAIARRDLDDEEEQVRDRHVSGGELHMAISMCVWKRVERILVADRTLLQFQDISGGSTSLHVAVQKGTLRQFARLLTRIELTSLALIKDFNGETALHKALRIHMPAAHYLIEVAPEAAYQVNHRGISPLYEAVQLGQDDLLRFLFQVMPGAAISPSVKESLLTTGKTSLPLAHAAVKARDMAILQVLMENLPFLIDSSDKRGWKPLSYAAYKGYVDEVGYFLNAFPESMDKYDADGSLPIHKAVVAGQLHVIKSFILACPQTLYQIDSKGRTILHVAVRYQKPRVITYLRKYTQVEKIFDVRDHGGMTFRELENEMQAVQEPIY